MDALRELQKITKLPQKTGAVGTLQHILSDTNHDKKKAAIAFAEEGYKTPFRIIYNELKHEMLERFLIVGEQALTKIQKSYLKTYKKMAQAKCLILAGKRKIGVQTTKEAIQFAKKNNIIDIQLSLCRDLENHYSLTELNRKEFIKYSNQVKELSLALLQEQESESTYCELVYCYKKKKDIQHLHDKINRLSRYCKINKNYRFRLHYYLAINLKNHIECNNQEIIRNTRNAISFFDKLKTNLPYTIKWNLLFQLIPIFISRKEMGNAEHYINQCLILPSKGSYNWHLTLLYKTYYGFYCNKIGISKGAYLLAHSVEQKFNNQETKDRWLIIDSYLSLYEKMKIGTHKEFDVDDFIDNIKSSSPFFKYQTLLISLLHSLFDGNNYKYMLIADRIEKYISAYYNTMPFRRTKYFLRMLHAVKTGNYHPVRVQAHAKKHMRNLQKYATDTDLELLEKEIVPYEQLWAMVLEKLKQLKQLNKKKD